MFFSKRNHVIAAIINIVAFVCVFSACSNNSTRKKLSALEEPILLQRLADYGITIPANLEGVAIRDAIAELEVDSDRAAPVVSWTEFADFYEELRDFVKEHDAMAQ